jgi:ribonuclease HI
MVNSLLIFTDGGARGNPGPAAIGYIIKDSSGKVLAEEGRNIGVATNNEAEYQAVEAALLQAATARDSQLLKIGIFLDSKLVAEQLSGRWRIKEPRLGIFAVRIKSLEKRFSDVRYQHIPREKNSEADTLLNQALDSML